MIVNTVTEAKTKLSFLLERVSQGEEVIISRAGKPIAILKPYHPERRLRQPGSLRGKIRIGPDFDELPNDIAESMGLVDS
jgi:prevent-host-death family protein